MFDTANMFGMEWPNYFGRDNYYNRRRNFDARPTMDMMFPCADYDYCEPERRQIPTRFRDVPKAASSEGLYRWNNDENFRNNQPTGYYSRASPKKQQQTRSGHVPRKCGNLWEIPVQFLDQNEPWESQRSPRRAESQPTECHRSPDKQQHRHECQPQRSECQPISIPVVHEPVKRASHHSRAMSEPATDGNKTHLTKSLPELSHPQTIHQSQPENDATHEPPGDANIPDFEQSTQEINSSPSTPNASETNSENDTQQMSEPEEENSPQQPAQPEKSLEEKAYEMINSIKKEVEALENEVKSFNGVKNDKQYRYLEEMLTRSLLKLDSIESGSNEEIRQSRRQVVRYIEAALKLLEIGALVSKVNSSPVHSSESQQNISENISSQSDHSKECLVSNQEQTDASIQEQEMES